MATGGLFLILVSEHYLYIFRKVTKFQEEIFSRFGVMLQKPQVGGGGGGEEEVDGKIKAENESFARKMNIITIIFHFCKFTSHLLGGGGRLQA